MRVVGCFIEFEGKFLLLQRSEFVDQPLTWALPAGKVESGETDLAAMMRELREETGYIARKEELEFLGVIEQDLAWGHLTFPTFRIRLVAPIEVRVNLREHCGFRWVNAHKCYAEKNVVTGLHELLVRVGYVKKK